MFCLETFICIYSRNSHTFYGLFPSHFFGFILLFARACSPLILELFFPRSCRLQVLSRWLLWVCRGGGRGVGWLDSARFVVIGVLLGPAYMTKSDCARERTGQGTVPVRHRVDWAAPLAHLRSEGRRKNRERPSKRRCVVQSNFPPPPFLLLIFKGLSAFSCNSFQKDLYARASLSVRTGILQTPVW